MFGRCRVMFGVGNVTGLGIWLWLSPVIIVGLRIGLDRESVEILVVRDILLLLLMISPNIVMCI